LHPHPYCSKFPPVTLEGAKQFDAPHPEYSGYRTGVGGKFQLAVPCIGNMDAHCQGPRQEPANDSRQRFFAAAACLPCGQGGVRADNALERLRSGFHG